jgi:hypothetical protein
VDQSVHSAEVGMRVVREQLPGLQMEHYVSEIAV